MVIFALPQGPSSIRLARKLKLTLKLHPGSQRLNKRRVRCPGTGRGRDRSQFSKPGSESPPCVAQAAAGDCRPNKLSAAIQGEVAPGENGHITKRGGSWVLVRNMPRASLGDLSP